MTRHKAQARCERLSSSNAGTVKIKSILGGIIVRVVTCVAATVAFTCAATTQQTIQARAPAIPQAGSASPDDARFARFIYDVVSIKPYKDDPNATSVSSGG